jgi:hypothetical protein
VRDQVPLGGVAWPLRTRLDAVPTLVVEEARVTAWLSPGKRKYRPYAFAEVENDSMVIRALVATEDLKVVVKKAFMSLPGHIPDGMTDRPVLEVESSEVLLDLDIKGATSTVKNVACSAVGLVRGNVDAETLLPPARGEVAVKDSAYVKTDDGFVPVRSFWTGWSSREPEGILGVLRGDDTDPLARRVSFGLCGGWVVGFVAKRDLLGAPKTYYGTSARCPNTGQHVFVTHGPLSDALTCPHELAVFLRSETLEDAVGVLKPGARFRVNAKEAGSTTLVWVEAPPAQPFEHVSFSVRTSDLSACVPAPPSL